MIKGLRELLAQMPEEARGFEGTEFPFPVSQALFGAEPELARLRDELRDLDSPEAEPKETAWAVLAAAELIESHQADRDDFFIRDGQFRGFVFTGIKWRAGWALLLGEGQQEYAEAFRDASFLVFTTRPGMEEGRFLSERETASVYFAQLLARYALLYSDVQAGERHELTHFVEDHGPGVLVVCGPMRPVEALLCLSLMRLGVGAIVASDQFPWEVGNRVLVSSPEEAVQATAGFQNLRIRSQIDPLAALPEYANPAYEREQFEPVRRVGGTPDSVLFVVRTDTPEADSDTVRTVSPQPEAGADVSIAIRIAVADPTLHAPARMELERAAAGYLDLLRGLRVDERNPLTLLLAKSGRPTLDQIGEVVRRGLRLEYPRLGPLEVTVATDPMTAGELAREARQELERRPSEMQAAADEDVVYSCESCAPFSREHVCFAHALRSPMCGRRWSEMLVGARYMGVSAGRPWRRRGRPENCCAVVPLGRAIDPIRGEYEGLNEFVRKATEGRMQRVFLHSVRDHPHSSCGCFGALAWWSEEMGGIGLMHRGFEGKAPDGSTWNALANRAGGKQQPGITGVSEAYMRSPRFLQGDGGWTSVKWMTTKLRDSLRQDVPEVEHVLTEET